MPNGFVQLPVDSTGKRLWTKTRTVEGAEVHQQVVVTADDRYTTARVMTSTWRTVGAAALTQNLMTIENGTAAGSGILVGITRMTVQLDATAALTAVAPTVNFYRLGALPTGGTALAKTLFDTTEASNAAVVARGATASNGGAATAITATVPAGTAGWGQFTMRLHTLAGQVVMDDQSVAPSLSAENPIVLRPGEAVLAQVVAAATTSNPATNHWVVNCAWEEYTV